MRQVKRQGAQDNPCRTGAQRGRRGGNVAVPGDNPVAEHRTGRTTQHERRFGTHPVTGSRCAVSPSDLSCRRPYSKPQTDTDAGPIVLQGAVPVRDDDTVAALSDRILGVEHRIYPAALRLVARALPAFDYCVTETHHSKKYDIPSGTAKKIASALEDHLDIDALVALATAERSAPRTAEERA